MGSGLCRPGARAGRAGVRMTGLPGLIEFADLDIMARTVWGEARGESREGKLAVAWVIMNRQMAGKWYAGEYISQTCQKARQFSCWNREDPNRALLTKLALRDSTFRECVWAAAAALAGAEPDPTNGATHYHTAAVRPEWAVGQTPTCTIGRHVFYRGIA